MTAVFDTNVLVAAILTEGVCSKLLYRARAREVSLVTCPFIMAEFKRIMTKKLRLTQTETVEAMDIVTEAISERVTPKDTVAGVCRDAEDDNVLACALAAKAGYLVTGDADLLVLKRYRTVKILSPRDFEELFV